ncbi:MAG TPA: CaiB/BaiF CoA-transferase family protein [Acidimicrobiales bacterium]|nr:CaiB/BaiF CoA-transferase family protein [Acidimicrobiales bacterium]
MPPDTSAPGTGPLAGVTVLDLSTVGPAARATRLLADYGAAVVKVGAVPGRGPGATIAPFFAYSAQRAMRRVQLDVRHADGREAFLALAATADVVVESFRPGVVDRLGIGYEALRAVNPAIVYCSTSGYGQSGPRSAWAGHDLNYLAVSGYLASCGPRADGGPPLPGATIADAAAGGMHAALAIAAALFSRHRTGEGTFLDVSVADGALWLMSLAVDEHLATGTEPGPGHDVLTGRYACYDTYRAADGRWLAVAAIEAKFFANLCRALGCEEWTDRQYDDDAQEQIRSALATAFARRDRDAWVALLSGDDTCVAPVQAVTEIAHDPQFLERGAVVEAKDTDGRSFCQVGAVLAGMAPVATPVVVRDAATTDTDDLLQAAGIDRTRIAELRREGVLA